MSNYKRQHYLPSGYMKFFSNTGKPNGRKTHIYYSDATSSKCDRTVESLSCDDYHYSIGSARDVEKSFQQMENLYPPIVEKILQRKTLTTKDYYGIILTMVEYHARNPSYKNITNKENYAAYLAVSSGIMGEIFGELAANTVDMKKKFDFLKTNWEMKPIYLKDDKFISSDHPSLLFSIDDELAYIFLPISPCCGIVAVDKRKVQIIGDEANHDDNAMLNGLQAQRCVNYLYSDFDLSEHIGEGRTITASLNKEKPRGFVKSDSFKPEYVSYASLCPHTFSFIKVR